VCILARHWQARVIRSDSELLSWLTGRLPVNIDGWQSATRVWFAAVLTRVSLDVPVWPSHTDQWTPAVFTFASLFYSSSIIRVFGCWCCRLPCPLSWQRQHIAQTIIHWRSTVPDSDRLCRCFSFAPPSSSIQYSSPPPSNNSTFLMLPSKQLTVLTVICSSCRILWHNRYVYGRCTLLT